MVDISLMAAKANCLWLSSFCKKHLRSNRIYNEKTQKMKDEWKSVFRVLHIHKIKKSIGGQGRVLIISP